MPGAGCWIRRKQKRRHDAEKAELLKRMEEETLRAKYAATGESRRLDTSGVYVLQIVGCQCY